MYFIKKENEIVTTNKVSEVTKENFVVDPEAENRVWVKLELYRFDPDTGEKVTVRNQINAVNVGDFEMFAHEWKRDGIKMTLLHDPRPTMKGEGVAEKLAMLNRRMADKQKKTGK